MRDLIIEMDGLIRERRDGLRELASALSRAFGSAADDDTDSLAFDEAERATQSAIGALESAHRKLALYLGELELRDAAHTDPWEAAPS